MTISEWQNLIDRAIRGRRGVLAPETDGKAQRPSLVGTTGCVLRFYLLGVFTSSVRMPSTMGFRDGRIEPVEQLSEGLAFFGGGAWQECGGLPQRQQRLHQAP
jgi:hypothetical protein